MLYSWSFTIVLLCVILAIIYFILSKGKGGVLMTKEQTTPAVSEEESKEITQESQPAEGSSEQPASEETASGETKPEETKEE